MVIASELGGMISVSVLISDDRDREYLFNNDVIIFGLSLFECSHHCCLNNLCMPREMRQTRFFAEILHTSIFEPVIVINIYVGAYMFITILQDLRTHHHVYDLRSVSQLIANRECFRG